MEAATHLPLAVIPPPPPASVPCATSREVLELRQQVVELRQQANYWESCFRRAKERAQENEAALRQEIEQLKAEIRALEERFTGRKAGPKRTYPEPPPADPSKPKRRRGHQPGNRGPVRRRHDHLPVVPEVIELPPDQQLCSGCGKPFAAMTQTDDGEILEIEVRAHRRHYRR